MPDGKPFAATEGIKTLPINLPPRDQQDQMLQQIETLLSGAKQVQSLLQKNQELMDQLLVSALREVFTDERKSTWHRAEPGILTIISNGQEDLRKSQYQTYPFIEAEDIDATTANVQMNLNRVEDKPAHGTVLDYDPEHIIFNETVTPDGIRRNLVAMPYYRLEAPPEKVRYRDNLSILKINDPKQLHPRFLFWVLQDPGAVALATGKKGGAKNKQKQLENFVMPLNLDEQKNISAYLDGYQEQLIQMQKSLQASQLIVDQMEGSILDQIFQEE